MKFIDKEIGRELFVGKCFLGAGIVAGLLAVLLEQNRYILLVAAAACLVVGGLMVHGFRQVRKDPALMEIYEASRDERNRAINAEAGMMGYWGTLFFVLALLMLSQMMILCTSRVLSLVLIFMIVSYGLFLWLVGRRT